MITASSFIHQRRSLSSAFLPLGRTARTVPLLFVLTACGDRGIVEPAPPNVPIRSESGMVAHAAVIVTPSYSTFDTRAEFNGAGVVDQVNGFDEFTGGLVYLLPTPWTTSGVSYTSALNIVLGPGVQLGVSSNALSTEAGSPLIGAFAAADAVTLFGADLTLIGNAAPVKLAVSTNVATYTFDNLDVPLATTGRRFFSIALSTSGEYLTGFRFSVGGLQSALLIDNVAVGHVGKPNADPEASTGGPYSAQEGAAVALALSGSDTNADALTFSWDLGDGTTGKGPTPPSSHIYQDDGVYEIMLAVADGRGGVDTSRTVASITNVAPIVASFSVPTAPMALTPAGVTLPISTTFTDVGVLDTHTSTLDCGVGAGAQSSAPNGTATGTCTFTAPGVYTVQITVRDDDGAGDTRLAGGQVVVYDAGAGWVTGGGWIASLAGAYPATPSVTGKLTFGFVARYESSTTTPGGNAEFKLNLGTVDFRSTSLDWMVVAGNTAQLRGRGTLNRTGDYAFEVTAVDGTLADAIRIRIWHRVSGVVVYDNQLEAPLDANSVTPLGGGSIQLHQR